MSGISTRSLLKKLLRYFALMLFCFAFYAVLAYLVPRSFSPLVVITEESAPRFLRFLLALYAAVYGCAAYSTTRDVYLPQIPHLLFCGAFRFYCYFTPAIKESAGAVTTVVQTEVITPPTVPQIILLIVYILIPVGFSLLISYVCRLCRTELHRAGRDRILFDKRQQETR